MGQKINQGKQTVSPDVDAFLMRYFQNSYQFQKLLSNGLMSKTALVTSMDDDFPLVMKIFFKSEFGSEFEKEKEKIIQLKTKIEKTFTLNICPITMIEEIDKAGLIIRQYYSFNLRERTFTMPYLSPIEKIWIVFQILFAVKELHTQHGICHGDIKMENILLNSNGTVYLSDISPYKPTYIKSDDISTFTYFFGTNDETQGSCYLAPERLLEGGKDETKTGAELFPEMDVFSLGALFVELFIDESLFDFSKLLNYKKGTFKIEPYLDKIKNKTMRELCRKMLIINPKERIKLDEIIDIFTRELCPVTIPRVMLHFDTLFNTTPFWKPDMIIGCLYKHWFQIWKCLFGLDEKAPYLYQQLNLDILNKLIVRSSFSSYIERRKPGVDDTADGSISLYKFKFLFNLEDTTKLDGEEELKKDPQIFIRNDNKECITLFLHYISNNLPCVKYESSGLVALEMMKQFSYKVKDITKLQCIVPYFLSMLKRKDNNLLCITSLHYLIEILKSIDYENLELPSVDYNIFDSYIYPGILSLYESDDDSLMLEFTNVLDTLIELEETFLNVALKSKLKIINTKRGSVVETAAGLGGQKSLEAMEIEKLEKEEACYRAYEIQLEEFKSGLRPIIEELLGKYESIEAMVTLIRKLPYILNFYGGKNNEEFTKFIITNFNSKEWVIQKEIVKFIPEFVVSLDEKSLTQLMLPCMEALSSSNINEHKIYELCKAIEKLIKMQYIIPIQGTNLFISVLPFLVHPNVWIRKKVMDIFYALSKVLNKNEIFLYLYSPLKDYLDIPAIEITPEILRNFTKERLLRIYFELELGDFDYSFKNEVTEDKRYKALQPKIESEKLHIQSTKISNEFEKKDSQKPKNNKISNESEKKDSNKPKKRTLGKVLDEEFKMFKERNGAEDLNDINQSFFGKIFWFSDGLSTYSLPKYINNSEIVYKEDNRLISLEQFKLCFLFKTLGISLKLDSLNELFEDKGEEEIGDDNSNNQNAKNASAEIKNYYAHKTFLTWKPKGRFISTLYFHKDEPIERLIPSDNNQFASFDSKGDAILWRIESSKYDNCYNIRKEWSYFPEDPKPISYNKTICGIDSSNFILASGNTLYKYSPQYSNSNSAINTIYKSEENNDITCCLTIGINSKQNQDIVFCNQNGLLNILDPRSPVVSLTYEIPIEKGMVSCICGSTFGDKCIYLGTLGGYIIKYDLSLNAIVKNFRYSSNNPIISLSTYKPSTYSSFDLYSMNKSQKNNQYLLVNAASADHEVGLWNTATLNCDLLFKVNATRGQDKRPLTLELPRMYNETNESNMMYDKNMYDAEQNLKKNFAELKKYTYKYSSNYVRELLVPNISSAFYQNSDKRLSKINSIYDSLSLAQVAISPYCGQDFSNPPYIFTAGNDMAIRYWDLFKDYNNNNTINEKRSYVFNAPNSLTEAVYTKAIFDNTTIIQSNEEYKSNVQKKDMPGFSEYLNFNGTAFCATCSSEFEETDENLKYCTKIADPAHSSYITDLLPFCVDDNNGPHNLLISGSWDGTVKVWA